MRYSLLIFLVVTAACQPADTSDDPLNVLVLYTDDQRFNTIAALGNDEIVTPNMDRLVAEGTAFTHAHTMGGLHGALCAPSRSMFMTGRPLFSLQGPGNVIPPEHTMMPEVLQAAGYSTFATGKWHNDRPAFARGFQAGDHLFFGGMHWPGAGGHEAPQLYAFDTTGAYPQENRRQVHGYSSMLYADAAIDFIRQPHEAPFFVYVSFTSPHDPRTPPAPYDAWYAPDSVSLPPNYMPEHPFDNGELRVRDEMLREHPRTEQIAREELALYYGMISEVDAQIGRILDALDDTGLRERTLVVFAGDNGLAVGSHGLLGKQNLYEHSMRVPLIFAGPGIPRGETRDALVYIHDIFPTIAGVLEISAPESVEGSDLLPVIQGTQTAIRDTVFYVYRDFQRGVRLSDGWKLVQYNVAGVQTAQLYNLNEDPHEVHNLAADPAHAGRLSDMESALLNISRTYNDPLDLSLDSWGKAE